MGSRAAGSAVATEMEIDSRHPSAHVKYICPCDYTKRMTVIINIVKASNKLYRSLHWQGYRPSHPRGTLIV